MRSCLTLIVLVVLGVFIYQMYQDSQEPISNEVVTEFGPEYRRSILSTIDPIIAQNPRIERAILDGQVLDLQYREDQPLESYRQDAAVVAEAFSIRKRDLVGSGAVTVRCIHQNLIKVEATADNGRVMTLTER